jgi:hypothetical protein
MKETLRKIKTEIVVLKQLSRNQLENRVVVRGAQMLLCPPSPLSAASF